MLKFGFTLADNDDLSFLLKPTDKLVGLLTGSPSDYHSDSGYYHESINIIIDKSCSGFNFFVLCFILFFYLTVKHFDKTLNKLLSIPASFLGAYLLTIFVNSSRIIASLVVHAQTKYIFPNQHTIVHEAIGVITNLSFLILAYALIDKFLTQKRHHAKLA